ncbi:MAG: bifunctional serine/threonine-protein kinase/formylglycine-generating enzyme family protein [Pseudomonadota bacterium]
MTKNNWQTRCPGCFEHKGSLSVCPHCAYDENERRSPLILPPRTLLQGQFRIGRMLGKIGGFGITYLAWDEKLETRVAIKEYLPRDLAGRESGQSQIVPHSREEESPFRDGLKKFIQEARTLALMDHNNIVRVRHFFEENGTGYLVMDYYEGVTLGAYVKQKGGKLSEKLAVDILILVLDGLREVHRHHFLHRDVKPQNIYLTTDGRIILLDFGAARQAVTARTRSLSVVYTPGYAPYEQYLSRGNQGPWTDIYGAAATLYFMVVGKAPPEAQERVLKDSIEYPKTLSTRLHKALVPALAVKTQDRPQTVAQWQQMLWGKPSSKLIPQPAQNQAPKMKWFWGVALLIFMSVPVGLLNKPELADQVREAEERMAELDKKPGKVFRDRLKDGSLGPEMVWIPAGRFRMGDIQGGGESNEKPVHSVSVNGFAMERYEVTVGEFRRFVNATGYKTTAEKKNSCYSYSQGWKYVEGANWRSPGFSQADTEPVVCVSWHDATAYAKWLSEQTGQQYRLPTEAQWEYVARAGTETKYWWGNEIGKNKANCDNDSCGDRFKYTAPVGSFAPNPFGIYDTVGNVWEWVQDIYSSDYYSSSISSDPSGPSTGSRRVFRSGGWFISASLCRAAIRRYDSPGARYGSIGFRLLLKSP